MPDTIMIADTSCLIALNKINALWNLESVHKKAFITETIINEYVLPIPNDIEIKEVDDLNLHSVLNGYLYHKKASVIFETVSKVKVMCDNYRVRNLSKKKVITKEIESLNAYYSASQAAETYQSGRKIFMKNSEDLKKLKNGN